MLLVFLNWQANVACQCVIYISAVLLMDIKTIYNHLYQLITCIRSKSAIDMYNFFSVGTYNKHTEIQLLKAKQNQKVFGQP